MSGRAFLFVLLSLAAFSSGCQEQSGGSPGTRTGGAGGGGSGSGGAGDGGSSAGGPPAAVCGSSKLSAPMLRRLTAREMRSSLEDVFPEVSTQWSSELSPDSSSQFGFDNDARSLVVGKQTALELFDTASNVGSAVSAALASVLPCSTTAPDRSCAAAFVDKYGKRLFRRPLSSDEHDRYLTFFDLALGKTDFKTAIGWVTRALIQSPATVYRSEIGTASGSSYTLSPYELVTELSYTFAGTTPSDAALAAADAGQVASAESRVSGAKALLQSSSNEVLQRFFASWIGYGAVLGMTKTNVPAFADLGAGHGLRDDMVQETRNFLQQVVVAQKGGPRELLTAPTTNPSAALASFYGSNPGAPAFPTPAAEWASITRPAGAAIGLLAQGSVLSALSRPDGSSPTKRGLLVFTRLLCREKPKVPDVVPPLAPATGKVVTTRDRYEIGHANGFCLDCHKKFDPIGFGFEQFDEVGRYRATDNGAPVNTVSSVPNGDLKAPLFSFMDLNELARGLANQDEVYVCASGYLTTYAFGVPDECLGETRRAEFLGGNLGFLDYFASLAAEPDFERRVLP